MNNRTWIRLVGAWVLGAAMVIFACLVMTGRVQATTINFDSLVPLPSGYAGNLTGPFRVSPVNSSVSWTLAQGVGGNASPAVFVHMEGLGTQSVNLMTYIDWVHFGLDKHDSEFTFKGVDIYRDSTAFMQVDIQGQHDATQAFGPFALSVGIPPGTGWYHYDLDLLNIPINTNVPVELAHVAGIGALTFSVTHVTGTPGVTVGFDNLRVCQSSFASCTFDAPISFNSIVIPPVEPTVTTEVTNVPEASGWIYLLLAGGTVLGLRKVFREETLLTRHHARKQRNVQ